MALPRAWWRNVQRYEKRQMYVIYFQRKGATDSCGYLAPTLREMHRLRLSDLDKLKRPLPTRWSELEPLHLKGLDAPDFKAYLREFTA